MIRIVIKKHFITNMFKHVLLFAVLQRKNIFCRKKWLEEETVKSEKTTNTISILEALDVFRKHIKMVIVTTLISVFMTGFVTFLVIVPKYESTTDILINRKLSDDLQTAQFQQVQANVQLISTYKDIITSPTVLDVVAQDMNKYPGYPGSESELRKAISITSQQNSQVFSVTAKSTNAKTAAAIANETASVFKQKIGKIMSINNVSIVSTATPSQIPYSPHKWLNLLGGLIVGLILGMGLALIREATDKTVLNESFLTDTMGWLNLGQVDEINKPRPVHDVSASMASGAILKDRSDK